MRELIYGTVLMIALLGLLIDELIQYIEKKVVICEYGQ
jgi:ABC-type nitrate/sulfonate/bicarbonate transport system permease component